LNVKLRNRRKMAVLGSRFVGGIRQVSDIHFQIALTSEHVILVPFRSASWSVTNKRRRRRGRRRTRTRTRTRRARTRRTRTRRTGRTRSAV